MEVLKKLILQHNLPLTVDAETSVKGNSFFAAVCQQLSSRPELAIQNIYTHASLRKAVCSFALKEGGEADNRVQTMAAKFNKKAVEEKRRGWVNYFTDMKKNGVFAENPVVHCLAWMLERDVMVVSNTSEKKPRDLIHASNGNFPPIVLGCVSGIYFQSLLPTENFDEFLKLSTPEQFFGDDSADDVLLSSVSIQVTSVSTLSSAVSSVSSSAVTDSSSSDYSSSTDTVSSSAVECVSVRESVKRACSFSPDGLSKKHAAVSHVTTFESLGESISDRMRVNVKAVEESFKEHFKSIEEHKKNLLLQQSKFMGQALSASRSTSTDVDSMVAERKSLHAEVERQATELQKKDTDIVVEVEKRLRHQKEGLKEEESNLMRKEEELRKLEKEVKNIEEYLKERVEEIKLLEVELKTVELNTKKNELANKKKYLELKKKEEELKKKEESLKIREEHLQNEQFNSFMDADSAVDQSF